MINFDKHIDGIYTTKSMNELMNSNLGYMTQDLVDRVGWYGTLVFFRDEATGEDKKFLEEAIAVVDFKADIPSSSLTATEAIALFGLDNIIKSLAVTSESERSRNASECTLSLVEKLKSYH